jgi:quinol monooxygenase YgiN
MHIQVVNFQLRNINHEEYTRMCEEAAATFAAVPGLLSKVWLADPATNTYGGVYTWRDREAMEDYLKSELFQAVVDDPHLANVTSKVFAVLEGPTRVTRGVKAAIV